MPELDRRSVLVLGAALATGGAVSAVGTGGADDCECPPKGVDSSSWSSYRGNAGNTGYVSAGESFPEPDGIVWEYEESGYLAAVDGTVYLNTGTGLHVLNDEDGSLEWKHEYDESDTSGPSLANSSGTPAVGDEAVFVGGESLLKAFEVETGEIRWTRDYYSHPDPTVAYGSVYVVADGTLWALDTTDGTSRWGRDAVELERYDGEITQHGFTESIAAANGNVYAITEENNGVAAMDAKSGEVEWVWWAKQKRHEEAPLQTSVRGPIAVDEDEVRVARGDGGGSGFVLDATTGEYLGATYSDYPIALADEFWIRASRGGFSAVNRDGSGDEWKVGGGTDQWQAVAIAGDTVVATSNPDTSSEEPAVVGFDLREGDEKWRITIEDTTPGSRPVDSSPVVADDTVYVNRYDGTERLTAMRATEDTGADEPGDGKSDGDGSGDDGDESNGSGDDSGGGDSDADDGTDGSGDDATDGDDGTVGDGDDSKSDGSETDDGESDGDDAEESPGFTTGAGLISGGLTLEWLRRRVTGEQESKAE